jgi:hypothetical protein
MAFDKRAAPVEPKPWLNKTQMTAQEQEVNPHFNSSFASYPSDHFLHAPFTLTPRCPRQSSSE